jgi:hypothetical protein
MFAFAAAFRLIAPVTALVMLGGCGDSSLSRTFGLVRDTPDEFTVVTRAPLSMPPDFSLRPPQPGAPRPQEQSARSQAESALVPDLALGSTPAGVSPGQAALVRDAGGAGTVGIRQRVDQDFAANIDSDGFIDKVLYWRKGDLQTTVVDPAQEARRLQQNSALGQSPATGDTPIIQEKKKGWFQSLFSWL